jgi:pimeloyl-ACP methyl ester carboxylesterase
MHTSLRIKMVFVIGALLTLTSQVSFSQMRYITVDGIDIWVNTIGLEIRKEGQPVVVFESGMGTPMDNWDKVLPGVSAMAPLIAYDRPGIGKSGPEADSMTIKGVSDRLLKILQTLQVSPPYLLVGHSLGGAYVRSFAVYYPEMLAGLIIIDPADFTETKENRKLPYLDIGLSKKTVDSLFIKWAKEDSARNAQNPNYAAEQKKDVLAKMRKSGFAEIQQSALPNIPVHILTGGRYDTPLRFRATEFNDSLLFRAKMRRRVERWTEVIQSVDKGMLFYSGDAGHFVHYDDPELLISSVRIVLQDYEILRK